MHGTITADLIHNTWPMRPGEIPPGPRTFTSTNTNYGTGVICNAHQIYEPPSKPAGTSKRITTFYQKTGVLAHRTDPGFRDKRAICDLTERPMESYGTLRRPLQGAGVNMLSSTAASGAADILSAAAGAASVPTPAAGSRGADAAEVMSIRSRASSQRSAASRGSRTSTQRTPSWAGDTRAPKGSYDFGVLPMYQRSNEQYGRIPQSGVHTLQAAGRSDSGFRDIQELIQSMSRPA